MIDECTTSITKKNLDEKQTNTQVDIMALRNNMVNTAHIILFLGVTT